MKLFKKITNSEKVKSFIYLLLFSLLMNNPVSYGTENKSIFITGENGDNKFEEAFFENSTPYKEYDNLDSQIKIFLGKDFNYPEKIFFPDLSIVNISNSLREVYKYKLNDMTINETNYNIYK